MNSNTKKFVKLFYLYQFCFDFILIYAVEKLFFLNRGLSLAQIGWLLFLWSVMSMILEVPTGILADRWSRRKMLVLSGIFFAIGYGVWVFSFSFGGFLLGFVFRTLGATFASGTLQAYVFDYLKSNQNEDEFEKIWGRGNALRTLGIGTAVLVGGFVSGISYSLTVILSSLVILSISIWALLMPEISIVEKTEEIDDWKSLKEAVKLVKNNRNLLRIVIFSGITLSIFASLEEFNDIYLKFLGYPNYVIGIVFALATVGQSGASSVAHKFKNHPWEVLNAITLVGLVILMAAALIKHPVMAIGILFLGLLLELANVLNEGIIQREVRPNQRATIASLNSVVHNLIPFQLIFGIVASKFGLQMSYAVFAVMILGYFGVNGFIARNK